MGLPIFLKCIIVVIWVNELEIVPHAIEAQSLNDDHMWNSIPMPKNSYFTGMDAPTNWSKWDEARELARKGELLLFHPAYMALKSKDMFTKDNSFRWSQCNFADIYFTKDDKFSNINFTSIENRAPIIHIGQRHFTKPNCEGNTLRQDLVHVSSIVQFQEKIAQKIICTHFMDSNWGWLSTFFVNRTATWAGRYDRKGTKTKHLTNQETIQSFLDNENLLLFLVNQHFNITHPKVLSIPLGVTDYNDVKNVMNKVHRDISQSSDTINMNSKLKKNMLLFTAGSSWKFRPAIVDCISSAMGSHLHSPRFRLDALSFLQKLVESYAVLCMPGLGYDTYRLWETLAMGAMPVVERGFGFERTLWKLPALFVDDFAYVTPELIRGAYVEAIYRRDEWQYERLTKEYWLDLIRVTSTTKSNRFFMEKHPMSAVDTTFTRPLVPFDCSLGCGKDTKRTPSKYCAVDETIDIMTYLKEFNNKH